MATLDKVLRSSNVLSSVFLDDLVESLDWRDVLDGSSGQSKPQWLMRHVRGPLARGLCDRPQSRGLFDASIGDRYNGNLKLGLLLKWAQMKYLVQLGW